MYASFKYGAGEREKDGRYFCDMNEDTLRDLLAAAGFSLRELFLTADVRAGRQDEQWINAIAEISKT